jgi:hypothetical protein
MQVIAAILWVHATLGLQPDSKLRAALFTGAYGHAKQFSVSDAAKVAWAMRSLSHHEAHVANNITEISKAALRRSVCSVACYLT